MVDQSKSTARRTLAQRWNRVISIPLVVVFITDTGDERMSANTFSDVPSVVAANQGSHDLRQLEMSLGGSRIAAFLWVGVDTRFSRGASREASRSRYTVERPSPLCDCTGAVWGDGFRIKSGSKKLMKVRSLLHRGGAFEPSLLDPFGPGSGAGRIRCLLAFVSHARRFIPTAETCGLSSRGKRF